MPRKPEQRRSHPERGAASEAATPNVTRLGDKRRIEDGSDSGNSSKKKANLSEMDIKTLEGELARATREARMAYDANNANVGELVEYAEHVKKVFLDAKAYRERLFDVETEDLTKRFAEATHAVRLALYSSDEHGEEHIKRAEMVREALATAKFDQAQRMMEVVEKDASKGKIVGSKELLAGAKQAIEDAKKLQGE